MTFLDYIIRQSNSKCNNNSNNNNKCNNNDKDDNYNVKIETPLEEKKAVVSIEIGQSGCAVAYAISNDSPTIKQVSWTGTHSFKTLTKALFSLDTPERRLLAFGYEARDLQKQDGMYKLCPSFSNFKMVVLDHHDGADSLVQSDSNPNESITAMELVSHTLGFLMNRALSTLQSEPIFYKTVLTNNDVQWVVTVPVNSILSADQFYRNAAGIDSLILCSESDAGAIESILHHNNNNDTKKFKKDDTFLVIITGHSTLDCIEYKLNQDNQLEMIELLLGGYPIGSNFVNLNFVEFLSNVFGNDTVKRSETSHRFTTLLDNFETQKVNDKLTDVIKVGMYIDTFTDENGKYEYTTEWYIEKVNQYNQKKPNGNVQYKDNALWLPADLFQSFFDPVLKVLGDMVLKSVGEKRFDHLVMIGGFSDSPRLQDYVNKDTRLEHLAKSKGIHRMRQGEAGMAVVRGACRYGLTQTILGHRITKKTFAIETIGQMQGDDIVGEDLLHLADLNINGNMYRKGQCDIFIKAGQHVPHNHKVTRTYSLLVKGQKTARIAIYQSADTNLQSVRDKGCERIGVIVIRLDQPTTTTTTPTLIQVSMQFGETKLNVTAMTRSCEPVHATFEYDSDHRGHRHHHYHSSSPPKIQLCLLLDCTASMKDSIVQVKSMMVNLLTKLRQIHNNIILETSFVGYRDHNDPMTIISFTRNTAWFEQEIKKVVTTSGGDEPEDIASALIHVRGLAWDSSSGGLSSTIKILLHSCDSPCHGYDYHILKEDSHPKGTTTERPEQVLLNLKKRGIQYNFIRINNSTDVMINVFESHCRDDLNTMQLGDDFSKLLNTIYSIICDSIQNHA
ncbi:hypothetical protein DFA_11435 [Cavenderia fasciculata]|uniref:Hemicentin-1-like von Willebrand factor A domain-containing protein n=1 Tax=Cavenderia fasciculata TaxID=261658 RepID=F4QCZ3_CACFS|nr:uncharacterized protein DFA_11435 [Cavenderia fasciculata]EGG13674.1 hypothetical protein DFA_11435 [Cavenderia fasciculata]|eukprot:XP_004350378.1 hypothetical protein DFA_11435 [Cavenderia fasciculata]